MAWYAEGRALVEYRADVLLVGCIYDLSRAVKDAHIHDALSAADRFDRLLDNRAIRCQHGVPGAVSDEIDKGITVFYRAGQEFLFLVLEKEKPEKQAANDHEGADSQNELSRERVK